MNEPLSVSAVAHGRLSNFYPPCLLESLHPDSFYCKALLSAHRNQRKAGRFSKLSCRFYDNVL